MSAMPYIEALLTRTIGLNPDSMGDTAVHHAVETRMKARRISGTAGYLLLLEEEPEELQHLIEAVVVPETWFFRDGKPFVALAQWMVREWLPANPSGTLRLASLPCSTGEEPYSMAMTLLEAGLSPDRFSVDAMEISTLALEAARQACYGKNAFRGERAQESREQYFREVRTGQWQLIDTVRRQVRFHHANLLAEKLAPLYAGGLDVIFCRNLLIYLEPEAQQRLVERLKAWLAPKGVLFAGHAEAYLFTRAGFETIQQPMAFAFRHGTRKVTPLPLSIPTPPPAPPHSQRARPLPRPAFTPATPSSSNSSSAPKQVPPIKPAPRPLPVVATPPPAPTLEECQQLADRGDLQQAIGQLTLHLRHHPPTARAHYLLAITHDAAGATDNAGEHYRKALYLEPNHAEALAHYALLARRLGDLKTARQLENRLHRVETRATHTARTA